MGTCFPMALLSHRMCLVVLLDKTLNFTHQRGARHPAVELRRIAAPANNINKSFAAPSRHGGSRYAPRESVDHRASPPMAVVGAGISTPNYLLRLQAEVGRLQQRLHGLCDRTEQERQERLSLEALVQRNRLHRSDDRSEFAFYQLENERKRQAFRDEVADIRRQHAALQNEIEKLDRDQKNLLEFLESGGCILPMKRPRADGTGGDDLHKT
uniref:RxLR effector candidate protein n=1 Tax=Hyaloperonospora arabidopsidis (strain Emoy2) TaxID=559515 RepID=M4C2X1_HYAAE